ncbi:hypothetical protein ACWD7F_30940 [Streptomyces sp. NPDC005122]
MHRTPAGSAALEPVVPSLQRRGLGPKGSRQVRSRALAVADYNHDRCPDLASYGHEGDGVYSTTARLGSDQGLGRESDEDNMRYTKEVDQTDLQTTGSMSAADLTAFYPACDAGTG